MMIVKHRRESPVRAIGVALALALALDRAELQLLAASTGSRRAPVTKEAAGRRPETGTTPSPTSPAGPERTPNSFKTPAHRVLTTARAIVLALESELGVDLRPNPIADAITANQEPAVEPPAPVCLNVGTTDQLIADHLTTGPFNWQRLAASIPALEPERAAGLDDRPDGQAIVLAEAGASAEANVMALRAQGLNDDQITTLLTARVPDALHGQPTLYERHEIATGLAAPKHVKPVAEAIYADLLASTGRHPTAVRVLAESVGAAAEVISLADRRARHGAVAQSADRARGLDLIEQWSAPPPPPASAPTPPPAPPEPPPPAA